MRQRQDMDEVCYDKVVEFVRAGHQVMVFVHARNATVNTAMVLKEMAQQVSTNSVRAGHQVMVFVHARNATVNTAMVLKEMAQQVSTNSVREVCPC
jgi:replicative superfamily II helicase